jgi:hypothetical protein
MFGLRLLRGGKTVEKSVKKSEVSPIVTNGKLSLDEMTIKSSDDGGVGCGVQSASEEERHPVVVETLLPEYVGGKTTLRSRRNRSRMVTVSGENDDSLEVTMTQLSNSPFGKARDFALSPAENDVEPSGSPSVPVFTRRGTLPFSKLESSW